MPIAWMSWSRTSSDNRPAALAPASRESARLRYSWPRPTVVSARTSRSTRSSLNVAVAENIWKPASIRVLYMPCAPTTSTSRRSICRRLSGRPSRSANTCPIRARSVSLAAFWASALPAARRKSAAARLVMSRCPASAAGDASGAERNSTDSRRSRWNSPTSTSPGLPTVSSSVRADSRLNAGPTVSVVAKTHSASSAASGTAINAMIFERIDQLRVFIRLRPTGSAGTDTAPPGTDRRCGVNERLRAACAFGRIRNRRGTSYLRPYQIGN